MDSHRRRGRNGRGRSRNNNAPCLCLLGDPNQRSRTTFSSTFYDKPWSFLSGLYSFCIMSSLMAIIYLMLDYHCTTCSTKCDLNSITKNIDEIAKNLSQIKSNYNDLELKISKFSQELPKIEGQVNILEAFANAMEGRNFEWNPRIHPSLPNVAVFLNKDHGRNSSRKCRQHLKNPTLLK